MAEVRCVFRAHYKHPGIGFYDLGQFELWLPGTEGTRPMNDAPARCRLFRLHFPICTQIDRDCVSMELYERR